MIKFNLQRYKELLAKENSSKKENQNLFNEEFFIELLSLESSVGTQVFYSNKNIYLALIQKYLDETIHLDEFRGQFRNMVKEDLNKSSKILQNFEELSIFWIDLELDEFSSLFDDVYEMCLSEFEFENQNDPMSENEFRYLIEKLKNIWINNNKNFN